MQKTKRKKIYVLLILASIMALSCGVASRKNLKPNEIKQVLNANKKATFLYGTYFRTFNHWGAEGIRIWLLKYDSNGKLAPKGTPIEFRLEEKNKKDTFVMNIDSGKYLITRIEYGSYDIPGFLARKALNTQKEIEIKESGISYLGNIYMEEVGYRKSLIIKFKNDFEADEKLLREKYPQSKNLVLNPTRLKESN